MSDAINYVDGDVFHYVKANLLKNNYAGSTAPTNPSTGTRHYDTDDGYLKIYDGSAWDNVGDPPRPYPEGTIIFHNPGYYQDGANGTFTVVGMANTVAGVNGYLNTYGWYVCDGAALNLSGSAIFDGAGRYLPNLDDSRFLMGDTAFGGTGGDNSKAHTHQVNPPSTTPASMTGSEGYDAGGVDYPAEGHDHALDIAVFTSGAASDTENRPLFLAGFYIIRAI